MVREQPRQGLEGQLPQPLALRQQPLLERRVLDSEPLEQVTPIERRRLLEPRGGAPGDQPLEDRDVDLHRTRVDRDGLSVLDEAAGGQGPADLEQRLAEAVSGSPCGRLAPEQRRQLVTRLRLAGMEGEVGEERLVLAP